MHSSDQVGFLFKNIAHCRSTAVLCNQTVFVTSEAHPLQTDVQAHCSFFDWKILEVKRVLKKKRTAVFFCFAIPGVVILHWLCTLTLGPLQHSLTKATTASRTVPETRVTCNARGLVKTRIQPETKTKDNKRHHNSLEGAKFGRMCAIS